MDVLFVGSGDAFGSGGRFQTCIRLADDGFVTLVDVGATSLTAMKGQGLDPQDVDAVVISHLHADHVGGLPFLILDGQFTGRTKPLHVVGPAGTAERLRALMEACYPASSTVRRRFDVEVVETHGDGQPTQTGPVEVRSWLVEHPSGAPALALRCASNGGVFGYSGDTAWTAGVLRAAEGTDVFACEGYTYDQPVKFHLDYSDVLEHRAQFDTGRLVLTHLGAGVLAQLASLEVEAADDGLLIELV